MKIISPRSATASTTTTQFVLKLDKFFFPTNKEIKVLLQFCNTSDFASNITEIAPSTIIMNTDNATISNATIPYSYKDSGAQIKHIRNVVGTTYVRVKITQDSRSYFSNPVFLSTKAGSGTIISKAIEKDFCPEYITFHDIYEVIDSGNSIDIRVYACNNALDTNPTWEEVTSEYLNNKVYAFKNKNKVASKYAVKVKIVVTKTKADTMFHLYRMQFIVT